MLKTLKLFFLLVFLPFVLLAVIWFSRSLWLLPAINQALEGQPIQINQLDLYSPLQLSSAELDLKHLGTLQLENLIYQPDRDQITVHQLQFQPALQSPDNTESSPTTLTELLQTLPEYPALVYQQLENLRLQTGLTHFRVRDIQLDLPVAENLAVDRPVNARLSTELIYQQGQWIFKLISEQPLISELQLILSDSTLVTLEFPLESNRQQLQQWLSPLIAESDNGDHSADSNPDATAETTPERLTQDQLAQLFQPAYWQDKTISLQARLNQTQLNGQFTAYLPDSPVQTAHCRLRLQNRTQLDFQLDLSSAVVELLPRALPELSYQGACLNQLAGLTQTAMPLEPSEQMPDQFELTPGQGKLQPESGRWTADLVQKTLTGDSLQLYSEYQRQESIEGGSGAIQLQPVSLDIQASQLNLALLSDPQPSASTDNQITAAPATKWQFSSNLNLALTSQAWLNTASQDRWLLDQTTEPPQPDQINTDSATGSVSSQPQAQSLAQQLSQWLLPGQQIPIQLAGSGQLKLNSSQSQLSYTSDSSPFMLDIGNTGLNHQIQLYSGRLTVTPDIRWQWNTQTGTLKLPSELSMNLAHPQLVGIQDIRLQNNLTLTIPNTGQFSWKLQGNGDSAPMAVEYQLAGSHNQPPSGQIKSVRSLLLGDMAQSINLPEELTLDTGELEWQADIQSPENISAQISIREMSGQYQGYQINTLSTELPLTLQGQRVHLQATQLTAERAFTGVELTSLKTGLAGHYTLTPGTEAEQNPFRITLTDGQAEAFDGSLSFDQLSYPFTPRPVQIQLREMNIQKLINLAESQRISVTGQLSGDLPVRLYDDGAEIQQGQIYTTGTGELILQRNPAWQAMLEQNQTLGASLRHLNHLHYDSLSGLMDMDKAGNLLMQIKVSGENRAERQPVRLNFNVEQNILTLLKALRLSEQISQTLDKTVQRKY